MRNCNLCSWLFNCNLLKISAMLVVPLKQIIFAEFLEILFGKAKILLKLFESIFSHFFAKGTGRDKVLSE